MEGAQPRAGRAGERHQGTDGGRAPAQLIEEQFAINPFPIRTIALSLKRYIGSGTLNNEFWFMATKDRERSVNCNSADPLSLILLGEGSKYCFTAKERASFGRSRR